MQKQKMKQVLWAGRIVVVVVSLVAFGIAMLGYGEKPIVKAFATIMSLVSAAWAAFGAAFGPVIILSLFWRRLNYKGAIASIVSGFLVDVLWMFLLNYEYYGGTSAIYNTGLYEIIPGFIVGICVAIAVSLLTEAPSDKVTRLFDIATKSKHVEVIDEKVMVDGKELEVQE